MKIFRLALILIFAITLGVVLDIPKDTAYALDDGIVFLYLDYGNISDDNVFNCGGGLYCLEINDENIGQALPVPTDVGDKTFLGWRYTENKLEIQIATDLINQTLEAVFDETENTVLRTSSIIVTKPQADTNHYEYDGKPKMYHLPQSEYYTVNNNVHTEAGRYNVVVSLCDSSSSKWDDGTSEDLIYLFEIHDYDISWEWTENYLTAKAIFNCKNENCDVKFELGAKITNSIGESATAVNTGSLIYEASVEHEGVTYTDTRTLITPKLNGTLSNAEFGIDVYSDMGFRNEALSVESVQDSESIINKETGLDFNILGVYSIHHSGEQKTQYIVSFDLKGAEYKYKDYALFKKVDSGFSEIDINIFEDKITCSTSTLGEFALIGIGKIDPVTTAQIALSVSMLILLTSVLLVLTITIIVKLSKIKSHKLAIKRY